MQDSQQSVHPYNTNKGWDDRYTKYGDDGAGTFLHSEKSNRLFYRSKFHAVDSCLKKIKATLQDASVLDAAGGSGKFVDFFLKRRVGNLLVTDFSQVALDKISNKFQGDKRVATQFYDLKSPEVPWRESFDFVFVMEAIFLLESDQQLAQAIRNFSIALKPNGYLIISDLFPDDQSVISGDYVNHRSKKHYKNILKENQFKIKGFVRQTFVFNRNLFGRFQPKVEQLGSFLFYLDRIAMVLRLSPPEKNNVKYLIAKKVRS